MYHLVLAAEGIEIDERNQAVRRAAEIIADWFDIEHTRSRKNGGRRSAKKEARRKTNTATAGHISRQVEYNPPLAQSLLAKIKQNFDQDPEHRYIVKRGARSFISCSCFIEIICWPLFGHPDFPFLILSSIFCFKNSPIGVYKPL